MTDFISREAVLEILRTPAASDTFPDMIRRVEALEGCGVRVKALEWFDVDAICTRQQAVALGGHYSAVEFDAGTEHAHFAANVDLGGLAFVFILEPDPLGGRRPKQFPTLEAAKAAAQADFDARIMAALEPVAQPETPIPGQFETMCLAIEDVITGRGFDVDPWQPIETAPENEGVAHIRGVWVHNATTKKPMYFDVCPGYLEDGGFIAIDGEDHGWRPDDYSHWMPLPQPPG